jgi:hypothetical protein
MFKQFLKFGGYWPRFRRSQPLKKNYKTFDKHQTTQTKQPTNKQNKQPNTKKPLFYKAYLQYHTKQTTSKRQFMAQKTQKTKHTNKKNLTP